MMRLANDGPRIYGVSNKSFLLCFCCLTFQPNHNNFGWYCNRAMRLKNGYARIPRRSIDEWTTQRWTRDWRALVLYSIDEIMCTWWICLLFWLTLSSTLRWKNERSWERVREIYYEYSNVDKIAFRSGCWSCFGLHVLLLFVEMKFLYLYFTIDARISKCIN